MLSFGKHDLAKVIAESNNISIIEATTQIDNVFYAIKDVLTMGGIVKIKGFGTFYSKYAKERNTTNPRTLEPMIIPARNKLMFRYAGKFAEDIAHDKFLTKALLNEKRGE